MKVENLQNIRCQTIERYTQVFEEQNVLVCDTETVKGKPYTIQFYDGKKATLEYVNEKTILDCYCDYVSSHYEKNLSVWFFYCQFDIPIIHYPFKQFFVHDNHQMGYGEFDFSYITGKTWFGNHTYKGKKWVERDAYQYVFRGLEKVAKDLRLTEQKKTRPTFLGDRKWENEFERIQFEEYAIADVLVLWELVYWILGLHRQYDVGLSVSLADLAGKIFRKHHVKRVIEPTEQAVTLAALSSYHGGKTESYVEGPVVIENIYEYDITSAYPYAMSMIGNFFDYHIEPWKQYCKIENNGVYQISTINRCQYKPLYTEEFSRTETIIKQWITGWEIHSCFKSGCLTPQQVYIHNGYTMISHNEKCNGLEEYVWSFFNKKQQADIDKNITERLAAKLFMNALYGKFISKIVEEVDHLDQWRGGVIFHPLIATLITGFVRAYVHEIEHSCYSLHTSTDSFITKQSDVDLRFPGVKGLGGLKKEYQGDVLIVRPKVYVIFDKLDRHCYHKFVLSNSNQVVCTFCHAKVLKYALHGFFGSIQMLLNMWKGGQNNYVINRMMRLKEATKRKDPDVLPFVFSKQRRSLKIDWNKLQYREE